MSAELAHVMFSKKSKRRSGPSTRLIRGKRPLSLRAAEQGGLRFVVVMDGGAAADDVAVRTALGAFRKGAVRGGGLVRKIPRPASRCSVRRTAAPRLTARSGAGRGRR